MHLSLDDPVLAMAPEAVRTVAERLYALHPELVGEISDEGRKRCREDLAYHVEYLAAAMGVDDPAFFVDYLRWLAEVLQVRSVPRECLCVSIELLAQYFARQAAPWGPQAQQILQEGLAALHAPIATPTRPVAAEVALPASAALVGAMLAGDRRLARSITIRQMAEGCGLAEIGARLIQPAMYEIGSLWQKNRISVAQEHLATAITQYILAQAFTEAPTVPLINRKALFANVETNHHALGLRIVADVFDLSGWDAQYLGANVPTPALLSQVDAWRPELLGLSVSMPQQFAHARAAIGALRAEFGNRSPTVLIGGVALSRFPQAAERIGADLLVRDAIDAETVALGP